MDKMNGQIADWAILVYMSADHILANFAVESLRQLQRGAGDRIIVLAQQSNGRDEAQRYVFDQVSVPDNATNLHPPIEKKLQTELDPKPTVGGIADPQNLTDFLKWAATFSAKHYCLFLWGHGYELLQNDDLPDSETLQAGDKAKTTGEYAGRKYLAPKSLKKALDDAKPDIRKLDVIGIDACFLSLVELACELKDHGNFMLASQDEVPDTSFPYDKILWMIEHSNDRDDVEGILAAIPELYAQSYQDYVIPPDTGMNGITLSGLRLTSVVG